MEGSQALRGLGEHLVGHVRPPCVHNSNAIASLRHGLVGVGEEGGETFVESFHGMLGVWRDCVKSLRSSYTRLYRGGVAHLDGGLPGVSQFRGLGEHLVGLVRRRACERVWGLIF